MTYAEVYLNGDLLGSHKGGYTPFEFEVTNDIKDGENSLFVMVDSTERSDIPPFGFVIDYLTYGGIYREVSLIETDIDRISHVFIDVINDKIVSRLMLDQALLAPLDITVEIKQKNSTIKTFDASIEGGENRLSFDMHLETWTLKNPVLYQMVIKHKNTILYESSFGKRDISFTYDGFYLNGEKIKLKGLNRHQSFPYVGYAMPSNAQRKDADILKYELGVNIVRSSHYPPSKHFLDRCDEIGLLVFNEIPGWQHIGNQDWQEVSINNVSEMITRDYNHPSICIWGVRINESKDDDAFYKETNRVAKLLDPYRPTGGVRNFKGSHFFEDVYTYNDFVHRGNNVGLEIPKSVSKGKVPYLVTEYNGHMYPTKPFDDVSHRVNQVKRHLAVQNQSFKDDHISGAIGWCMFDYNTHKDFGSGDRICYHGVMDMFRNPKYASYVYASQSDSKPILEIASNLQIGDFEASEIKEVIVLTNADYIKFYINDDFIGDFYPSDAYKYLPHPPVIIDDFIGNMIHENESFKAKDADKIKDILLTLMRKGMKLPLTKKLAMLYILTKYKMSIDEAAKLYEKYVGKWGLESLTYRFDAVQNHKVVSSKTVGTSDTYHIEAKIDDKTLKETSTYQTTRITLKHKDQHDNVMPYSREIIEVETKGPIELIGPNTIVLTGGMSGFYVKTTGKKGNAVITIKSDKYKIEPLNITIK
jgi:beta-galactosidase